MSSRLRVIEKGIWKVPDKWKRKSPSFQKGAFVNVPRAESNRHALAALVLRDNASYRFRQPGLVVRALSIPSLPVAGCKILKTISFSLQLQGFNSCNFFELKNATGFCCEQCCVKVFQTVLKKSGITVLDLGPLHFPNGCKSGKYFIHDSSSTALNDDIRLNFRIAILFSFEV